jgi:hypothetical protein
VDSAERYLQLSLLGKEAFLKSVAAAALVRRRGEASLGLEEFTGEDTQVAGVMLGDLAGGSGELEIFPLAKKPGAPFADMITVGRTANNDVVIKDVTVSRFHAFFRERDGAWIVCDAGSKNGTSLAGKALEPRKEKSLGAGAAVRIGDVETTFYDAVALFDILTT